MFVMKDTEIMKCKHCTKVNKHLHLYSKEENKNYIMCLNCGEIFLEKKYTTNKKASGYI